MSKKTTTKSTPKPKVAKGKPSAAVHSPVRYSALPKLVVAAAKAEVTPERIAAKAFELYAAGRDGGEVDHWLAAEAELRQAA